MIFYDQSEFREDAVILWRIQTFTWWLIFDIPIETILDDLTNLSLDLY